MKKHQIMYKGMLVFTEKPIQRIFSENPSIDNCLYYSKLYRDDFLAVREEEIRKDMGIWGTDHAGYEVRMRKLLDRKDKSDKALNENIKKLSFQEYSEFQYLDRDTTAMSEHAHWSFCLGLYWIPYGHFVETRYW